MILLETFRSFGDSWREIDLLLIHRNNLRGHFWKPVFQIWNKQCKKKRGLHPKRLQEGKIPVQLDFWYIRRALNRLLDFPNF